MRRFTTFLFLLLLHTAFGQNIFQKAFNTDIRPFREDLSISFKDKDGNETSMPFSIIKGKTDGPVFTIIAGIHGFEYPPIVAVQAILKEIDIDRLKGTLIVVPIANTTSFYARTPFINPLDRKNLNNVFPGKEDGTISEKIGHFITSSIIPVSDVFLDVHGGDAPEDLIPFVCYYNNIKKPEQTLLAKKLSEKSGFQYVISYPYTLSDTDAAKYTFKQAVQDGKTALSIECGKLGNVQEENVNLIKKGIYNMLATMNMYQNGTGPHPNMIYYNNQSYIRSSAKGIFYSDFKAGDSVKKNEVVGYTTDEFGTVLEEYKSPKNGIILYKLATPPINVDDMVMCISSNTDINNEYPTFDKITNMTTSSRKELCKLYLQRYAQKDLAGVEAIFAEDIILRDWKIRVEGKKKALKETKKNFEAAKSIEIEILEMHQDKDTVAAELKITVNETEELYVVDVITFNSQGLITSIRAYLGRGDE
ncbi:nuclear transport factor 2 family protein [Flagellimonas meridianipacifica]|uniref:Uncharacterized protein n=1 Tax=Flagellimonas meridianipacifica TaxID=1080225 RepID=A0A2T0M9M3_9FLAO|nr:succinylglutamate desuccinylase/aspartoacylase family protein [Allomuricauda pacifica]PRX54168.1 hypothetical protein CLV81_2565 [Allomuricauda pacifica]